LKIAIGTAQFGMNYGIANKSGRIKNPEIHTIIELARQSGVDMLDTAISYGDSEDILGSMGVNDFKVITKLPHISFQGKNVIDLIERQALSSIDRLKIDKLDGILLHQPDQLFEPDGSLILEALINLKAKGITEKIGVSIYSPNQLDSLFELHVFDIVQAPLNILDRRLINSGWLDKLKEHNTEVHARSIFLQGLLLMSWQEITKNFSEWDYIWNKWFYWLDKYNITASELCMNFVSSVPQLDRVVIGIDSTYQLKQLLSHLESKNIAPIPNIQCNDEKLINPSLWRF
jgi:aryl-alcohol dehydrogenase-like predicted oxidoreductase